MPFAGQQVGLKGAVANRLLRFTEASGVASSPVTSTLPNNWPLDVWTVVDIGGGNFGLHNTEQNRFLTLKLRCSFHRFPSLFVGFLWSCQIAALRNGAQLGSSQLIPETEHGRGGEQIRFMWIQDNGFYQIYHPYHRRRLNCVGLLDRCFSDVDTFLSDLKPALQKLYQLEMNQPKEYPQQQTGISKKLPEMPVFPFVGSQSLK